MSSSKSVVKATLPITGQLATCTQNILMRLTSSTSKDLTIWILELMLLATYTGILILIGILGGKNV